MEVQQVWIRKNGAASVLSLESAAGISMLSEKQVQIQVQYSGINFADVVMRLGLYKDAPKKPYVPGYEVAGKVIRVGSQVKSVAVGDEVVAGTLFGGYASQVVASEEMVFKVPAHLSLQEAAALPVNWITAHAALVDMGRVRPGDRVLVDSASGGVGSIALQLLAKAGAEVVGLTGSRDKIPFIESFGARGVLHTEFAEKCGSMRFDLILNSQGGSSVREHYNQLAPTGRVIAYGMSAAIKNGRRSLWLLLRLVLTMPRFSLIAMFDRNRGVFALNALQLLSDPEYLLSLRSKWKTVEAQKIKPHVDRIFPAAEVAEAHRYLESRKAKGKVLLQWG